MMRSVTRLTDSPELVLKIVLPGQNPGLPVDRVLELHPHHAIVGDPDGTNLQRRVSLHEPPATADLRDQGERDTWTDAISLRSTKLRLSLLASARLDGRVTSIGTGYNRLTFTTLNTITPVDRSAVRPDGAEPSTV